MPVPIGMISQQRQATVDRRFTMLAAALAPLSLEPIRIRSLPLKRQAAAGAMASLRNPFPCLADAVGIHVSTHIVKLAASTDIRDQRLASAGGPDRVITTATGHQMGHRKGSR